MTVRWLFRRSMSPYSGLNFNTGFCFSKKNKQSLIKAEFKYSPLSLKQNLSQGKKYLKFRQVKREKLLKEMAYAFCKRVPLYSKNFPCKNFYKLKGSSKLHSAAKISYFQFSKE